MELIRATVIGGLLAHEWRDGEGAATRFAVVVHPERGANVLTATAAPRPPAQCTATNLTKAYRQAEEELAHERYLALPHLYRVIAAPGHSGHGNVVRVIGRYRLIKEAWAVAKQHGALVVIQECLSGEWPDEDTDWADWAHQTAYAAGFAKRVDPL